MEIEDLRDWLKMKATETDEQNGKNVHSADTKWHRPKVMRSFLILLLPDNQTEQYNKLCKSIQKMAPQAHHLGPVWLVKAAKSAREIRDEIAKETGLDGQFLVTRLSREAAWLHLPKSTEAFLKKQL